MFTICQGFTVCQGLDFRERESSKQDLVGNVESYLQKVSSRCGGLRAIDRGVQLLHLNVNFQDKPSSQTLAQSFLVT